MAMDFNCVDFMVSLFVEVAAGNNRQKKKYSLLCVSILVWDLSFKVKQLHFNWNKLEKYGTLTDAT